MFYQSIRFLAKFVFIMKYKTIVEVADKIRVSQSTLYRYVRLRKIPYIKQGHRVLFLESDIDEWMMSHRIPAIEN